MLAAAGLCLAIAVSLQIVRDRAWPREMPAGQQILYVRSPQILQRLVLGFDALAADVYWIRAIQHYGGQRLSREPLRRRYDLLYPLLDMTTSLDPYFNIAYRFGAIFLSEAYPGGPGRPDHAIQLLHKGIVNNPGKWEYFHDIAFIHYWTLNDRFAAAAWFRRAAAQPDAPDWLLPVAAAIVAEDDRASARYLWRRILASEEAWLRRSAERALMQLDALDQIDELNRRVAAAGKPQGQPYSWAALVQAGRLPGIPVDPADTPYEIDPVTGDARLSIASPLYPLPPGMRRR